MMFSYDGFRVIENRNGLGCNRRIRSDILLTWRQLSLYRGYYEKSNSIECGYGLCNPDMRKLLVRAGLA